MGQTEKRLASAKPHLDAIESALRSIEKVGACTDEEAAHVRSAVLGMAHQFERRDAEDAAQIAKEEAYKAKMAAAASAPASA